MPDVERLRPLQAVTWHLETTGQLLHTSVLWVLDGPLDFERLVAHVAERLPAASRFRQRVAPVPFDLALPAWEPAPGFDLRLHVIRHVLRAPADDEQMARLVSRVLAQPLDRRRPLWELHLLEGHRDGRAALLVKVHQSMLDGLGDGGLLELLADVSAAPGKPVAPAAAPLPVPVVGASSVWTALREGLADAWRAITRAVEDPAAAWRDVTQTVEAAEALWRASQVRVPDTPFNGHVSTLRRVGWVSGPLAEVQAVKNRLGGTIDDVVLAAISAGLRRWIESRGASADRVELQALRPVELRRPGGGAPRLSVQFLPLPVGIYDARERFRQMRAASEQVRRQEQAERNARILGLVDRIPPPLQAPLAWLELRLAPINTLVTTLPGSPVQLYLLGRRVTTLVPLCPLAHGVGLAFAVVRNADTLTVGVVHDPALLRDGDRIAPLVGEGLAELAQLAQREGGAAVVPLRPAPRSVA